MKTILTFAALVCIATISFGQAKKTQPFAPGDSLATHTAGPGHGTLGFRIEDPSQWKDRAYRITLDDHGGFPESWVTIFDLAEDVPRVADVLLDSVLAPDFPTIDGFRLLQGAVTLPADPIVADYSYNPPANDWMSYNIVWESGDSWGWGTTLSLYYDCVPIKLVFSDSNAQNAYVYLRGGTPNYDYAGWGKVPFQTFDVSDSAHPRQLNVAFVENNVGVHHDMKWLPYSIDDREYLFIFKSTYTGTADPFYSTKNMINDAMEMDIMYACWAYKNPSATEFYHSGDVLTVSQSVPISFRDTYYVNINGKRMDVTNAPHIISIAVTTARAKEAYSYTVIALGVPAPVFQLMTKPVGMSIDSISGAITWTPTNAQVGNNDVTVRATNTLGYFEQSFTIIVQPAFGPPQITSIAITTAVARSAYSYQVTANGQPAPVFMLLKKPVGMSIDSISGVISWMPTDAQVGKNDVAVSVVNTFGFDAQSFTIVVQPASSPPKITSIADSIAVAQTSYSYQIIANGSPAPRFHLTASPTGMIIDTTSGLLLWTPQRSQFGSHAVTITATNSSGSDVQSFTIAVYTTPDLQSIANQKVKSDTVFQYTAVADAYPSATFSLDTSPTGMTIGSTTGVINWTPTKAQSGNHSVQVRATNPYGNMQRSFTITVDTSSQTAVSHVQDPLYFSIGQSFPNPVYVSHGEALVIPITATRPVRIRARIFDEKGMILRETSEEIIEAGRHELRFDLNHSTSGNYFCSLEEPDGKAHSITFVVVK